MSDNTPTFTEALETLAKALNINFSTLAGDLFEDVETARQAFIKRAKEEKNDAEKSDVGAQSSKFNRVDFWPAMDSDPDDLDAALHKLGVDKPDDEDSVECSDGADCARCEAIEKANSNTSFHVADIDDAFKEFQRLQAQKGAQFVPRDVSAKPAVETWEILIRDTQDTVEVETDHVEIDGDFDAWRNDTHVLHVPAGEYLYAKKVSA